MLSVPEGMSCNESLEKPGLVYLGCWRVRGCFIEVCKIMRDVDRADGQNLFPRVEISNTRGDGKFRVGVWGKFFTLRLVGAWNVLSGVVVEADKIVAFKRPLDRHMNELVRNGSSTGRIGLI